MPIFREQSGKLIKLNAQSLPKEKILQNLIENNLEEALGMYFLDTEYRTTFGGRIDTLAVDYSGAPVIIEYKRNRNDNVINQGLSYLRWLKAQKEEFFEMLIIKRLGEEKAKEIEVDWNNPRVVCIAESYSKYDTDTVEVIPMRIELFKYRFYNEKIFSLEPFSVGEYKPETSAKIVKSKSDLVVGSGQLLEKASPQIFELYENLRARILEIDEDIVEKTTSLYVAYRVTKNFAEIYIGKNQLKIFLRPLEYYDPRGYVEKISEGYNWTLNRRVYMKSSNDLEYVMGLLEESYKDVL